MTVTFPGLSLQQMWEQLVPAVPWVIALCAAYLILNDALDVILFVRGRSASDGVGFFRALGRVGAAGVVTVIRDDVASTRVVGAVGVSVWVALLAGGDTRAQLSAALVGVAVANVGSFEASTLAKLGQLFSPLPPLAGGPPRVARGRGRFATAPPPAVTPGASAVQINPATITGSTGVPS